MRHVFLLLAPMLFWIISCGDKNNPQPNNELRGKAYKAFLIETPDGVKGYSVLDFESNDEVINYVLLDDEIDSSSIQKRSYELDHPSLKIEDFTLEVNETYSEIKWPDMGLVYERFK